MNAWTWEKTSNAFENASTFQKYLTEDHRCWQAVSLLDDLYDIFIVHNVREAHSLGRVLCTRAL